MLHYLNKFILTPSLILGLVIGGTLITPHITSAKALYKMPRGGWYASNIENKVVYYVNKERTKQHLQPLKVRSDLRIYARDQSRAQYIRRSMYHGLLNFPFRAQGGQNVEFAAGTSGYDNWTALENPKEAVTAWMASPEHRRNILTPRYRYTGVGVASGTQKMNKDGLNRWVFFTQDFAN